MAIECLSYAAPTHGQVDRSLAKTDLVFNRLGHQSFEFLERFCCLPWLFEIGKRDESTPEDSAKICWSCRAGSRLAQKLQRISGPVIELAT